MFDSLNRNFGLLIAFVLPGFVFILGHQYLDDPGVLEWPVREDKLDQFGSLLLVLLASTAVGIVLSAIRWLVLDNLHHVTGIPAPLLDFHKLEQKQASFMLVVENNYRYYLFYGNTLIALLLLGWSAVTSPESLSLAGVIRWSALCAVLYFASRDSLQRYYMRSRLIMGETSPATTVLYRNENLPKLPLTAFRTREKLRKR